MTMSTLTIKTDNKTRLRYVTKIKDKLLKNCRENDKELVSGAMPETPGETKKIAIYKILTMIDFS